MTTVLLLFLVLALSSCGRGPTSEETALCERAVSYLEADMFLERRMLFGHDGYDSEKYNVQDIHFNFRSDNLDRFLLSGEMRADPPIMSVFDFFGKNAYSGCVLETVSGMAGKKLKDLPDDTPIYHCRIHTNHVILAKKFK